MTFVIGVTAPPTIEAEAVRLALLDRAEDLFREAWGEPERPGRREWRPRDDDARAMEMRGPKRGLWRDHRDGAGGDLLDLFAVEMCGLTAARDDFPRVLAEAAAWCGIAPDAPGPDPEVMRARREERAAEAEREAEADATRRAELVARIEARAEPVEGSPAAAYLARRGIAGGLPEGAFAYLPPVPGLGVRTPSKAALVAWARDPSGRIVGGQRILIEADGARAAAEVRKPAFGSIGGAPCLLPPRRAEDLSGPLYVVEGPETAAAVWLATGAEVWAVFGAGQFEAAPLPLGRRVVLCPDRDAPESPAAAAFARAVAAHKARGVDVWIAEAPEPEGSKRDLADTCAERGAEAVRAALEAAEAAPEPETPRDATGRFTGAGAFEAGPVAPPEFVSLAEAEARIRAVVSEAMEAAAAWDGEGEAPAAAIAASPGAGKTHATLATIAASDLTRLSGDVVAYASSGQLAGEMAAKAEEMGAGWHVTRGRSAINPATGKPMCERAGLAERVAGRGCNVTATLCKRQGDDGTVRKCPHFERCAYWRQWDDLPAGPVLRFESHAYLMTNGRPDPSGRPIALRVVDEKSWPGALRTAELRAEALTRPGTPKRRKRAGREALEADAADRAAAGAALVEALRRGGGEVRAVAHFGAEALEEFAKAERASADAVLEPTPDAGDDVFDAELNRLERIDREATKRAALWDLLADCLRRGLETSERIEFLPDFRGADGKGDPRDVIRLHWRNVPARTVPELHLDADADPEILAAALPGATLTRVALRPNADVVQVTDKTFSNFTLMRKPAVRAEAVALVEAEAFADRMRGGAGAVAVATKKVVRAVFEDAGLVGPETPREDADRIMRETTLHGARWAWFGPGLLGLNAYADMTTVVVIGREEMPVEALEARARALFGDEGEPLTFVEPDARGRRLTPEVPLAYTMDDGSGAAVMARAHPDARIRALQRQGREANTWQSVERLRLARAPIRKRVVIACKVPVPGLPVTALTTWETLVPGRIETALVEAEGVLRLSAKGLHADAPREFKSEKAAEGFTGRAGITPHTACLTIPPVRGVIPTVARIRLRGQRGAKGTLALIAAPGDPRAAAEAKFGPLAEFEIVAPAAPAASGNLRDGKRPENPPPPAAGEFPPPKKRAAPPERPAAPKGGEPAPDWSDPGELLFERTLRRAHELRRRRRDPPARVVYAVKDGARTPGAVARETGLGASAAYRLIAELVALGRLERDRGGTLRAPPDAPPPPETLPDAPPPSLGRPALTWRRRPSPLHRKAPEDCVILTPEQQREAHAAIDAHRRRCAAFRAAAARAAVKGG